MNKNGWVAFIFNIILTHLCISFSSLANQSGIGEIVLMATELGVAFYLTQGILNSIKVEHFKHINEPHWSHKPYQRYFEDKDLKLF